MVLLVASPIAGVVCCPAFVFRVAGCAFRCSVIPRDFPVVKFETWKSRVAWTTLTRDKLQSHALYVMCSTEIRRNWAELRTEK